MGEGEAALTAGAGAAKDALREVLDVFADYLAPIMGLVAGWALSTAIGGVQLLGDVVNNFINPGNNPANWPTATLIAGIGMAGIWSMLAFGFWSIDGAGPTERGKGRGWAKVIIAAVMRFLAGVAGGLAISSLIQGVTDSPASGWLDNLGNKVAEEVNPKGGT